VNNACEHFSQRLFIKETRSAPAWRGGRIVALPLLLLTGWLLLLGLGRTASPMSNSTGDGTVRLLSGHSFPAHLQMAGATLDFVGGGDRFKYWVVNVYTVAAYFDRGAYLNGGRCDASAALSPEEFEQIVASSGAKALMLHFNYAVSAETMIGAMVESLEPRCRYYISRYMASRGQLTSLPPPGIIGCHRELPPPPCATCAARCSSRASRWGCNRATSSSGRVGTRCCTWPPARPASRP